MATSDKGCPEMNASPNFETQIAILQHDISGMRGKMDDLIAEIRESNKHIKDEQIALDRRVRSLEEDRIRMRLIVIPITVVISALLSYGSQVFLENFKSNNQGVVNGK